MAAGYIFSAALGADGVVYIWGDNEFGQLGTGTTIGSTSVPAAVNSGTSYGVSFSAIAAGNSHILALAADGTVQSWGNNTRGQLGNSSSQIVAPIR